MSSESMDPAHRGPGEGAAVGTFAEQRRNVATWCRIMQVGPACAVPCGGCKGSPDFGHDHWGNKAADPEGVCRVCLGEPSTVLQGELKS